jgi:hypothetical protein
VRRLRVRDLFALVECVGRGGERGVGRFEQREELGEVIVGEDDQRRRDGEEDGGGDDEEGGDEGGIARETVLCLARKEGRESSSPDLVEVSVSARVVLLVSARVFTHNRPPSDPQGIPASPPLLAPALQLFSLARTR